MPPKSKRMKMIEAKLEKARERKRLLESSGFSTNRRSQVTEGENAQPTCLEDLAVMSSDALDTMKL